MQPPNRQASKSAGALTPGSPLAMAPLAVTMGEPAGIGPDITLAAWRQRATLNLPPFVVLGCAGTLRARARQLVLDVDVASVGTLREGTALFARALPVLSIATLPAVQPGTPNPETAHATIAAIETAVDLVKQGEASAIVTNPIAKSVLYAAGFRHPGHTEFLAELAQRHWGTPVLPVMMIASDLLRVVPLTIHVPLAEVPGRLTAQLLIDTVRVTAAGLARDFGLHKPRIAVAGLNPHAGEGGTIGTEDQRIIVPAIAALQAEGLAVTGPHPADTLFHPAARARYDVVIGMYHDQVLVPAKTLAFDTGVNVTLGLPFVRTSPDHGTAFDIAGTGRASPQSLIAALHMAQRMVEHRRR